MPVIDVLMLRECGGRFAGPMEPEEFLDRFLSRPKYPDGKPRRRPDMSWNDVLEAKVKEMYEPYVCLYPTFWLVLRFSLFSFLW